MSDQKRDPFKPGVSAGANLVEAGLHQAVCVALIDTGSYTDATFGKKKRGVVLTFELPQAEPIEVEGKKLPRHISCSFNSTLNPKGTLRPFLESWRGKALTEEEAASFSLESVLGKPAQVNVMHEERNGKTHANIKAALPVAKGTVIKASSPVIKFSVEQLDEASELEQIDIPEWIKKLISESDEYKKLQRKGQPESDNDGGGVDDGPGGGW